MEEFRCNLRSTQILLAFLVPAVLSWSCSGDKTDPTDTEIVSSDTPPADTPPSDVPPTTSSVCDPLSGPCEQGGSCTPGNICSNGSACEDFCYCKDDATWECDLVRQHPCGCNEIDGFCLSNDGCNWCGCDGENWLCTASACNVDVPDSSPGSD
jgi:hypothetical protein